MRTGRTARLLLTAKPSIKPQNTCSHPHQPVKNKFAEREESTLPDKVTDEANPYESPTTHVESRVARPELRGPSLRLGIICCVVITLLYWAWESQACGNIRIDLLLAYPLLFGLYIYFLQRLSWISLILAFAFMVANYCFFAISYSLFDKPLG